MNGHTGRVVWAVVSEGPKGRIPIRSVETPEPAKRAGNRETGEKRAGGKSADLFLGPRLFVLHVD